MVAVDGTWSHARSRVEGTGHGENAAYEELRLGHQIGRLPLRPNGLVLHHPLAGDIFDARIGDRLLVI